MESYRIPFGSSVKEYPVFKRKMILGAWIVLSAIAVSGCGGSGLVNVKGAVTMDGQPIEGATVIFVPSDSKAGSGSAMTDASGHFSLTTRQEDGVAPGEYRVTITKKEGGGGSLPSPGSITDAASAEEFRKKMRQRSTGGTAIKYITPIDYADQNKTPFADVKVPGGSYQFDLKSSYKYDK